MSYFPKIGQWRKLQSDVCWSQGRGDPNLWRRRNDEADFKARVALEALKGEGPVSELASEYGVHPTMIQQWKKTLFEGAADIFERDGKKKAEVDEETVRSLDAKIGELAVANDFVQKAQAVDRQVNAPVLRGRVRHSASSRISSSRNASVFGSPGNSGVCRSGADTSSLLSWKPAATQPCPGASSGVCACSCSRPFLFGREPADRKTRLLCPCRFPTRATPRIPNPGQR